MKLRTKIERVLKNKFNNFYVWWVDRGGEVHYDPDPKKAHVFKTSHEAHDVARHCGATVYKRKKKFK